MGRRVTWTWTRVRGCERADGMAYLSRSAPTRGEDLARYLPDDLFEEAPTVEQALKVEPVRGITFADLEVVRECAGSPGPALRRFVPETSQADFLMKTTMGQQRSGGFLGALKRGLEESPSYTLSPQSSLKPASVDSDKLASSFGAEKTLAASPLTSSASPPVAMYSYATSAGSNRAPSNLSGKPPRGAFKPGSSLPPPRGVFGDRAARESANHVSPAIKFTGSAFRSARDEYLDKVIDFLRKEGGEEWVSIKSKSGVSGRCRKPVTMPENYLEFFDTHRDKFEINGDRTKVRLREHVLSDSGDSDHTGVDSLSDGLRRL